MSSNNIDVEEELARILQEEIWKELEATTGMTKEMLNQKIIDQMVSIIKNEADLRIIDKVIKDSKHE